MNLRRIIFHKRYFLDYYDQQSEEVLTKIEWTFDMIKTTRMVPEKYFKHISGTKGLFEIRIEHESNLHRIFSFFDKGNVIVLGNAFQKKSQKHRRRK